MKKHTSYFEDQAPNKKPKKEEPTLLQRFKPGDLLYGLEQLTNDREGKRCFYRKLLAQNFPSASYLTIDHLNNHVLPFIKQYQRTSTSLPMPILETYWQHLKNFKTRSQKPIYDFEAMQHAPDEILLRKLCKAALFLKDAHIHFCLDDIDIERVATRIVFNKQKQLYNLEKAFTALELRCIYRHWDELSNKVTFYLAGEKVAPPWETNKESWVFLKKAEAEKLIDFLNQTYQKGASEGEQLTGAAAKLQFFIKMSTSAYELGLKRGLEEQSLNAQKTAIFNNSAGFFAREAPPSPTLKLPQADLNLATYRRGSTPIRSEQQQGGNSLARKLNFNS